MVVRVGPYQRIVGFHWPDDAATYITSMIKIMFLPVQYDGEDGDDGIAYPLADPGTVPWYAGIFKWEVSSYESFNKFYDQISVYDASGALIESGNVSDLGASVSKPSLPAISSFAPWSVVILGPAEMDEYQNAQWDETITDPADPLFPSYRASAAIAFVRAATFTGGPEKRSVGSGPPTYYEEFAPYSGYSDVHSFDMTATQIIYGGNVFFPIGARTSRSTAGGRQYFLSAEVLLKKAESSA